LKLVKQERFDIDFCRVRHGETYRAAEPTSNKDNLVGKFSRSDEGNLS